MATPGKTPTKGRKFVALHVRHETDTDILMLSWDARALLPLLLVHAGAQGDHGLVPSDPRAIQLFARHPAGVSAVAAAMVELTNAGFLLADELGNDGRLYLTLWEDQPDLTGSVTRSKTASESAFVRYHNAGKHTVPREGCPLCYPDPVAHSAPDLAPVQDTLLEVPTTGVRRMSAVLADVRASLDESIVTFETPYRGYIAALGVVDEMAGDVADLSKDARGSLRNAVLAHALVDLLGDKATGAVINAANRGAKALGETGHARYIYAAVESAQVDFATDRSAIAYLAKVAKSENAHTATRTTTPTTSKELAA